MQCESARWRKRMSVKPVVTRALVGAIFFLCAAMEIANAVVSVSPLFSNHMVVQRGKPVPIYGMAASAENVSVTFSGYIGDVFLYKKALTDVERQQLETYIAYKLTGCAIKASAGGGGAITPSGTVLVTYGANQGFTITPSNGNSILDVLVDGASVGAVSSYTFNGVTANHTISVKFSQVVSRARWERWS